MQSDFVAACTVHIQQTLIRLANDTWPPNLCRWWFCEERQPISACRVSATAHTTTDNATHEAAFSRREFEFLPDVCSSLPEPRNLQA